MSTAIKLFINWLMNNRILVMKSQWDELLVSQGYSSCRRFIRKIEQFVEHPYETDKLSIRFLQMKPLIIYLFLTFFIVL